jgi:2-iminobutanoate/2-iminopropanoate deaminase
MKAGSSIAAIACAIVVSGCMTGGRGWIPNGPGDSPEKIEARTASAPAPAPKRPAPVAQAEPATTGSPFRNPPPPNPAPAATRSAEAPASSAPVSTPAPAAAGGYTQATRYGDLLFISGQIAMDPRTNQFVGEGKMDEQTRQVMENIRAILEANRLTMANVVSVTVYIKDLAQFRAMDEAYEKFFRSTLPARSVVEVARLPRGALVEISVIAGR